MKFNKEKKKTLAKVFMWVAVAAVFFAGLGAMGSDIWLASTQWLLVAAVSVLFAIYLKVT